MRDEHECSHEQEQHRGAVLRIAVDLARHSHQTQQPCRLQQPDQGRRLKQATVATLAHHAHYYLITTSLLLHY